MEECPKGGGIIMPMQWEELISKAGMPLAVILRGDEIVKEVELNIDDVPSKLSDEELLAICNEAPPDGRIALMALGILADRLGHCTCAEYLSWLGKVKKGTALFFYLLDRADKTAQTSDELIQYWIYCERGSAAAIAAFKRIMKEDPREFDKDQWLKIFLHTGPGTSDRQEVVASVIHSQKELFQVMYLEEIFLALVADKHPADQASTESVLEEIIRLAKRDSSVDDLLDIITDGSLPEDGDLRNRCIVAVAPFCDDDDWDDLFSAAKGKKCVPELFRILAEEISGLNNWIRFACIADKLQWAELMVLACSKISERDLTLEDCRKIFDEAPVGSIVREHAIDRARALAV